MASWSATFRWMIPLAAALGGASWYAFREKPLAPIDVVTAHARKAAVVRKVRAAGHVEPVNQVRVSANISGDLLSLKVKEGDEVKRGQLIGEIDPERYRAIVRQAEATLRSADSAVALEQVQLDQSDAELARVVKLGEKGLATGAEVERARSSVEMTRARMAGAKERVAQAKAGLDEATARFQQTRLVSPIDGTIIHLAKKAGERVRGSEIAEDIVLIVAPLHAMEVEVEISEQEVVNVELGQKAEIEIDALEGDVIPGRVVEIANSATIRFRGEERETTSFEVTVALDRIPERLRSGMSATVAIVTAVQQDALAVPLEAVTARLPSELDVRAEEAAKKKKGRAWREELAENEGGDPVVRSRDKPVRIVFVVENGRVEPKRIETGIFSDRDIVVERGVEPGAEIVIGPYRALARELLPGTPVTVVDTAKDESPKIASEAPK